MKLSYALAILITLILVGNYLPSAQSTTTASSTINISITIPGGGGGGGGGTVVKNPAVINFSGYAYPEAIITFLKDGKVIGTALADDAGLFSSSANVEPGVVTLGIWARSKSGLNSATTNVRMSVVANAKINIANIFLSPTITADKFKLQKGGTLRIYGDAFPGSLVRIFNNLSSDNTPIAEVRADVNGLWEYYFPTEDLGEGQYSIKANAQIDSPFMVSEFSENLEFTIAEIKCSGADFNFDSRVNIVDFSILIFYWQRNPSIGTITNICTDLNKDEIVNIFDFSILMYDWTD